MLRVLLAALCLAVHLCAQRNAPPARGRVFLISLDGMGHQLLTTDPVAQELRTLHRLSREGAIAEGGIRPAYPSTTGNSHAALWTGAYGDVNGIHANSNPIAPRTGHTAFERNIGFRSDSLRAEPVWVTAARQGVPVVGHQVTQAYPFRPINVGTGQPLAPVVVNGYQTKLVAPDRVLQRKDMTAGDCSFWAPLQLPDAAPSCLRWEAEGIAFHALPVRSGHKLWIASSDPQRRVEVTLPRGPASSAAGPLARNFSDGLLLETVPGSTSPAVVYFRLFAAQEDGSNFLLYQSPIHELGYHDGTPQAGERTARLLREAGGFLGNGPTRLLERGAFGPGLSDGGDGTAERRYLEVMELVTRQMIRHAEWLFRQHEPRLFITYLNYPDELDHTLLGLARLGTPEQQQKAAALRRRGYAIVERAVAAITALAGPRDHVLFTADHGMAPVAWEVKVNVALKEAGLLAVLPDGKLDESRTQAVLLYNCLLVNTTDWKNGVVAPAGRGQVVAAARKALEALRDPATGQPVVTAFLDSEEDRRRYGFGGPNGADACFDFAPTWAASPLLTGPVLERRRATHGAHGFHPDRPDMRAILLGRGPRLKAGTRWRDLRSVDVAALVADLLGIQPPAQNVGRSPLGGAR